MSSTTADLILEGGTVVTMAPPSGDSASAVAIKDGRIVAVGGDDAIAPWLGRNTRRLDVAGRAITPGVVDTHTHLAGDSRTGAADRVECRDFYAPIASVNDILGRMRDANATVPDGQAVIGTGSPMQDLRLVEKRLPTRAELDDAVPDRPAFVTFGAHVLVANSKAIEEAELSSATPDPQGGMFERATDGSLTGVVRERAQIPFRKFEKIGDFESFKDNIEHNLLLAAQRGTTMIHDIVKDRNEMRAYQELNREGRLPVRVQMIIRVIESNFEQWSLLDLGLQHGLGDDKLRIGGIKMSIDGGFTGRQSAWSDVHDEPCGNHPLIRITQDELDETVKRYDEAGMRICVHAIGDIASDMILSSYEKALAGRSALNVRHRVEHLGNWLFTDDKIERSKAMGITPVPNPSIYRFLAAEAIETLGPQRNEEAFPIRRILDEGMVFAPGSDAPGYWPVDPLRDAGATVSRESVSGAVLAPDQAIESAEAFAAITSSAAWLSHAEDRLGTIELGKLADIAVLERDPRAVDGRALGELGVAATVIDGRLIHDTLT